MIRSLRCVRYLVNPRTTDWLTRTLSTTQLPRKVLVSTSTDILENLALEDWLYENHDFDTSSVMLLYRDAPCVVVGRHQNPWVECDVPGLAKFGLTLARRKSGGGTVYHDEGNLNCSFIVPTSLYDRKKNLQMIIDALKARWDVNLSLNKREDIVLDNTYKVSGTASRLKRHRSYHHFTLLLNVDKHRLQSILYSNMTGVSSNATKSNRVSVANLAENLPNIDFDSVVHAIGEETRRITQTQGIEYVQPTDEERFPGVHILKEEFQSWEWTYGKTPPFSVHRRFHHSIDVDELNLDIKTNIVKGCIENLQIDLIASVTIDPKVLLSLRVGLQGVKLDSATILAAITQVKMDWIANNLYTVKTSKVLDLLLLSIIETLCV